MSHPQTPLQTELGPGITAAEVVAGMDLSGRTVLVTGGTSGLGLETVRVLAGQGAEVIVAAPERSFARAALPRSANVEFQALDLLDRSSVERFAAAFLERHVRLDILILNAGVMAQPLFRDVDGREGHLAVNYLGHFRLTAHLLSALFAAGQSRVVILSSRGHQLCDVDLDDLDIVRRPYDKWTAYGQSKTANALFSVSLDRFGRQHGIRAFAVHPGMIVTPGIRHLSREQFDSFKLFAPDGSPIIDPARDMKTVAQGAATIVWCATSPLLASIGGVYCENCDVARLERDSPEGVRPYAVDPQRADLLWQATVSLTGLDIPML